MKEDDVGKVCGMYRREGKGMQSSVGKPEGTNHFEDICVHGRIILKLVLSRVGGCGLDLCDSG
jgi:hypothetical protein